jgi:hypothetical protein
MNTWDYIWLGWIAAFLILEAIALINDEPGDTLSENIWQWFAVRSKRGWHWRRWILAIFLVWLLVHMVAGF